MTRIPDKFKRLNHGGGVTHPSASWDPLQIINQSGLISEVDPRLNLGWLLLS